MTQYLYIYRGLPGSGRSESAMELIESNSWVIRISRADIGMQLYGYYHPKDLGRFEQDNISLIQKAQIEAALNAGLSVVVDNENLDATSVKELYYLANKYKVEPKIFNFDVHFEKCIRHDAKNRNMPLGEKYIRELVKKFVTKGHINPPPENITEAPMSGKRYEPNPNLPKAVWLDADGTFFKMLPELRGPFDFHLVHLDPVQEHIVGLVKALQADGYKIVVMTGRDESCRQATWDAFVNAGVIPDDMFMRPNDTKDIKDYQIKEMLFWENVYGKYDIHFALDDRNSVVKYTREVLGIPVLQVAPGDF